MRILMVGAGGVGGVFGARLIQAGADVTFLLRPARRALIECQGLVIESPHGDFVVRPRTVAAASRRAIAQGTEVAAEL